VVAALTYLNGCCAFEEISKRKSDSYGTPQPEYVFRYSSPDVAAELNELFSYSLANNLSLLISS